MCSFFRIVAQQHSTNNADVYISHDGKLVAKVLPSGTVKGFERAESRVAIHRRDGKLLRTHDFSSEDGEHGYGFDVGQWTLDSEFFVFYMSNSGGHSPMFSPVLFWWRKENRFFQLNGFTADETFSVSATDEVQVRWPGMKSATVSLRDRNVGVVVAWQYCRLASGMTSPHPVTLVFRHTVSLALPSAAG